MKHHVPAMRTLSPDVRMMYVSRHIYLLAASLVNVTLGLYLHLREPGWRRSLQLAGSVLTLSSVAALVLAFLSEPALGLAGRGWRSFFGLIGLFAGVLSHLVAATADRSSSVN